MTEKRALYLGQPADDVVSITNIVPRTVMLSFGASDADRQKLRKYVVRVVNGIVGTVTNFPNHTIKRVVQFQVSEPWRSSGIQRVQKWHCDVYVLCEIAPEPTSLNQGLEMAWMQADAELEALGDESPDVVAGARK